ncbi:MAG: hypothetical protein WB681_03020 [Candidatus Cybelea sp.]
MRKPPASPQGADTIVPAHPLAEWLIDGLRERRNRRVLDFASGSGRNARALSAAGLSVVSIDDLTAGSSEPFEGVAAPFAAALSTHGLLHGAPSAISAKVRLIAEYLEPLGLLYATFGSRRDERFGKGSRIDALTFAPMQGDERGVAHAFFDRAALRAILEPRFAIEYLEEHAVDAVAGSWAHRDVPLSGAVHWFTIARMREGLAEP